MERGGPTPLRRKRVCDLVHGDHSAAYGVVTHREGRKVWFEKTVVTFGSEDDEVVLESSVTAE